MVVAALAAICLIGPASGQDGDIFPKPGVAPPSDEYRNWSGFGFLPAGDRSVPQPFQVPGDWTAVQQKGSAADDPIAPIWRMKVVIFHRVDRVEKLPDGTLWEEKNVIEKPDLERVKRAIQQLKALVRLDTSGKLNLKTDVVVEDETILPGERTLKTTLCQYLYPRINGGNYQGEDTIYRGPYASVICVHPVCNEQTEAADVLDTPCDFLSAYGGPQSDADGWLATQMHEAWIEQVRERSLRVGVLGPVEGISGIDSDTGLSSPAPYVPAGDWASVLSGEDQAVATIDAHLKLALTNALTVVKTGGKLMGLGFEGVEDEVKFEKDPARGSVLTYSEQGGARNGGVAFPTVKNGAFAPTLTFWVRSDSPDPLALCFDAGDGKQAMISIGRDLPGPSKIPEADFTRDGQWHLVKVDLKGAGINGSPTLSLQPTPNSLGHAKLTYGQIVYSFADFKTTADAADAFLGALVPDPDSPDPLARAEWSRTAMPSPKLLGLLKDPAWFVRLNALQRYIGQPDPTALESLILNATTAIDGPVGAAAVEALWKLNSEAAKVVVKQVARTGVTELSKAEAGLLLSQDKNAESAADLEALTQSRSLSTRIASVRALGQVPGVYSETLRFTCLNQSDPELKLEATRTLDPNDVECIKKLRWSAVDEPSDAVRYESDLKLIQSGDPAVRADGYKGVKDDSIEVRLLLLRFFAEHPSESDRDALRVAVTDRSSSVKAAAIRAFAALEKGATPEELGAAVTDRHPAVQLALLELKRLRGFKLPEEAIAQMKQSPDPRVQVAVKQETP